MGGARGSDARMVWASAWGRWSRGRLLAAVVAAWLASPTTAEAWVHGTLQVHAFPTIRVTGNGQEYTDLTESTYEWKGSIRLETKWGALIKGWHLYPILQVRGMDPLPLSAFKESASYPVGQWAASVEEDRIREFPAAAVRPFAILACNRNANTLREQGRSNKWIFERRHTLAVEIVDAAGVDVTVGDKAIEHSFHFREIVCEKWTGVPPERIQDAMEVRAAQLALVPATHVGTCPVDIAMLMRVKSDGVGSFEAWVESSDGWKSKKMARSIGARQGGEYQVSFSEKLPVPIVLPAGRPSGGGAGSQASGGKMAVTPGPGDTLPPKGGPPIGGAGLAAPGRPGNVHRASLRLVAVGGGKTVASGWQDYTVTCEPKVTAGLQHQGGLAPATGPSPVLPQGGGAPGKSALPAAGATARLSPGLPDLVHRGLRVGGHSVDAGGVETLSASQASSFKDGRCRFRIVYHVDNAGAAKTPGQVRTVLSWDGTVLDDHAGPALDAGERRARTVDAYLTPGEHALTLRVDPDRAVPESDEGNNVRTARVRLNGPCATPVGKTPAGARPPSSGQLKAR